MNLKKIQIRHFPPGINLQVRQQNGTISNRQINLFGMGSIEDELDLGQFVEDSIFKQSEFQFLRQYSKQILDAVKKVFKNNTEPHLRRYIKTSTLRAHKQPLTSCKFSKYGDFFATSSYDRTCKLWQTQTGLLINSLGGHTNAVFSIDISENNNRRLIATGSLDKTIKIWSPSGKRFFDLKGHQAQVTKVEFNPNGLYVLSSSMDGLVKVWDLQKGKFSTDLKGHQVGIITFSHNFQGDQVICTGFNGAPKIFDLRTNKTVRELQGGHQGQVTCCKFQFTGEICATAGTDMKCVVWDIGMNQPMQVLQDHSDEILDLDFNNNGSKLATASADSTVCLYNVNVGTLQRQLRGHQRQVTKVKFSQQGDFLLSTGFDGIARVWMSETGQNRDVLEGHQDEIFSSDIRYYGDKIITCSKDSSCIVWRENKEV